MPRCCFVFPEDDSQCAAEAEFSIHGSNGHPDEVTEVCPAHVGPLLGDIEGHPPNSHWLVYPLLTSSSS